MVEYDIMPLYSPMDSFREEAHPTPVELNDDIPKEMDVFYRKITAFLPSGKTLSDLTPEELAKVKAQYRFDPMKPGIYQGITGFGHMF